MNAEMRLLNIVDREASGTGRIVKATFELHAADADFLRGKAGKRFGAALVEIGDDEKPVEKSRPNHAVMRAGQLCNDKQFQTFLSKHWNGNWIQEDGTPPEKAAGALRTGLSIKSRADLATNHLARDRFDGLVAKFEMWKRGQ